MPINSIITQPATNSLYAAYRPIIFRVVATATSGTSAPPVVYCDIYFGNIYYKTVSRTQYATLNPTTSEWEFDIQDAAQEYLKKFLANNGTVIVDQATPIMTQAHCKFRSSGINSSGFIQHEGTAPIQGTGGIQPVSGTGTSGNSFFILNATLQHEDTQDLATHLSTYKRGTWGSNAYPVTHRPNNYRVRVEDSDSFPFVYLGNEMMGCLVINYRLKNQTTWRTAQNCNVVMCPLITNLQSIIVNNGNGTQTITFSWDTFPSGVSGLIISHRAQGSTGAYTNNSGTAVSPRSLTVALGLYEFRFESVGPCIANPVLLQNVGVPPTPCTALGIIGTPDLPSAIASVAYNYVVQLSGTAPFALSSIVKPAWMNITVNGNAIEFTGTPGSGDVGSDIPVSFTVKNCFNAHSVNFTDTVNVSATGTNNAINIYIMPGVMDVFEPTSCWQWEGTVSIYNGLNALMYTQTWNSHGDPSQFETLFAPTLTDDTYRVEWSMRVRQACSLSLTSVRYIKDGSVADPGNADDSRTFSLTGNTTTNIELHIDSA